MNNKLILGTVQFGLNYGINNSSGIPSEIDVFGILDTAFNQHIVLLDTADAYGNAIELIGKYHLQSNNRFKVLSKFKEVKANELCVQVQKSLNTLHIDQFEVYSYHSFNDYLNYPFLKDELQSLKSKGLIKKIGISVYTNPEIEQICIDDCIDVIQLPFNLLDNQNIRGKYIEKAKQNNKEIHTRSVFLQGLLFMNEETIPQKFKVLKPYIEKIRQYCLRESISVNSLALSYAIYKKTIDHVLIGVDTKDQLLKNIESIADKEKAFDFINQNINVIETELLNPVNWK